MTDSAADTMPREFRHHRTYRYRSRPPHAFTGILLILVGALFLLANLHIINVRPLIPYWPVLLVAWGGARILLGHPGEKFIGTLAVGAGVVLLGNHFLDWNLHMRQLWPLIPMAIGLRILRRAWGPRRWSGGPGPSLGDRGPSAPGVAGGTASPAAPSGSSSVDEASTLNEFAMMSGIERRNVSQTFRGGSLTAILGGVDIDLRDTRMAENEARLNLSLVLGGVSIRIPRTWTVESHLANVLAGFEDQSEPPAGGGAQKLVIEGHAILGGVEIKN